MIVELYQTVSSGQSINATKFSKRRSQRRWRRRAFSPFWCILWATCTSPYTVLPDSAMIYQEEIPVAICFSWKVIGATCMPFGMMDVVIWPAMGTSAPSESPKNHWPKRKSKGLKIWPRIWWKSTQRKTSTVLKPLTPISGRWKATNCPKNTCMV